MEQQSNRLVGKDLITIGIYSAIYFVIMFAVAMLGMIPFMYPMLAVLVPIIGGVVYMLYLTKVKKFGMIWIMSILMGLLMIVSGMGYYALIVGIVSGLVADIVFTKVGKCASAKMAVLSNGIFSIWVWANFLLLFLQRDFYMASREASVGAEYVQTLNALMPDWMCPVLLVVTFACGIIGGFIGLKMLKKHFEKAGIA